MTISVGKKVRLKNNPALIGIVMEVKPSFVKVFINGNEELIPIDGVIPFESEKSCSSVDEFISGLVHNRIKHKLSEQLLSYRATKTDLLPHQFIPVRKILANGSQRLLIADEVGVGKTIEAGLIWAELEARYPDGLESVLIVCPKSLCQKWKEEMEIKFDFDVEILDSRSFRTVLNVFARDGCISPRYARSIINLESIRLEETIEDSGIAWDLVIFDEAHHLRNTSTASYAVARTVSERAGSLVLMTATPVQNSTEDLLNIFSILGLDTNMNSLNIQLDWDMRLNNVIRLVKQVPMGWLESALNVLRTLLNNQMPREGILKIINELGTANDISLEKKIALIEIIKDAQFFSPYMTRTMRSQIDLKRPMREPITMNFQYSPIERRFYEAIYDIAVERAHDRGVNATAFLTQMVERRTASSVHAVAEEILQLNSIEMEEELEEQIESVSFSNHEVAILAPLAEEVIRHDDTKLQILKNMLNKLFKDIGVEKAMIFSTFRKTLSYLSAMLKKEGYKLDVVHGGIPVRKSECRNGERSREEIASDFRAGKFQILLASEVAGEGLDFEHCNAIINFDLPWNPMRVEQRIGRCDRYGQKSEKVYIGNFSSNDTIEGRMLERLFMRVGIFQSAMGDMEAIFGELIGAFGREVFSKSLTAEQQAERLDRIAEAVIVRRREQEKMDGEYCNLLSSVQRFEVEKSEFQEAEKKFLDMSHLKIFIKHIFSMAYDENFKERQDGKIFELRYNEKLESDLAALPAKYSKAALKQAIRKFKKRFSELKKLKLSFEKEIAKEDDSVEFFTLRHPLMLLARSLAEGRFGNIPRAKIKCSENHEIHPFKSGDHFLVYWSVISLEGYISKIELVKTAYDIKKGEINDKAGELAEELIIKSEMLGPQNEDVIAGCKNNIEEHIERIYKTVMKEFSSRNGIFISKAVSNLERSNESKMRWIREYLRNTGLDERIRRLYEGRLRNATAAFNEKKNELMTKVEIACSLQTIGTLEIEIS